MPPRCAQPAPRFPHSKSQAWSSPAHHLTHSFDRGTRIMTNESQENAAGNGKVTPRSEVEVEMTAVPAEREASARTMQMDHGSAVDTFIVAVREVQDSQGLVEGQAASKAGAKRDLSLDLFRGLVMVLMVIDHTQFYFLVAANVKRTPGEHWDDILEAKYPRGRVEDGYDIFCFLTRALLTNTVAPGFCILMGMGLQLMIDSRLQLQWTALQIIKYLVVRGAVIAAPMNLLMVLRRFISELVISPIRGVEFIFRFHNCILFALGVSLALASFIVVPLRTIRSIQTWRVDTGLCALAGIICLVIEQAIVYAHIDSPPTPTVLSTSFILPGMADRWTVSYSILPILGITLLGASFGRLFTSIGCEYRTKWRKFTFPFFLAVVFFALFCIVRASDAWGNTNSIPIQLEKGEVYWEAFFRTTKYPFSIAAALYSCGFNLLLLSVCALLDLSGRVSRDRWFVKLPLELGGASLMGYIVHLWVVTFLFFAVYFGLTAAAPYVPTRSSERAIVQWLGRGGVLLVFIGVVLPAVLFATYAVCKRFGAFKRGTAPDSLWRLF